MSIAWTGDVPLVTELVTAEDGQPSIVVHSKEDSLRVLHAALVLACRDGWADAESAQRSYIEKACAWAKEEAVSPAPTTPEDGSIWPDSRDESTPDVQ